MNQKDRLSYFWMDVVSPLLVGKNKSSSQQTCVTESFCRDNEKQSVNKLLKRLLEVPNLEGFVFTLSCADEVIKISKPPAVGYGLFKRIVLPNFEQNLFLTFLSEKKFNSQNCVT